MPFPIRHPDVTVLGEALNEEQYTQVWEPRGWERVSAAVALAADVTGERVTSLEDLTVPQLRDLAASTPGAEVPTKATKAELITVIEEARASQNPEEG